MDHQGEYGSQSGAIHSIAGKIGCTSETLRRWVRQAERDEGLRQFNEILRKASAYFAQAALDRRFKP